MQSKHIANTMKTLHTLKAPRQCATGGLVSPALSPKLMALALIIALTGCDRIQSLKGEVQEKAQAVASHATQCKTDVAEWQEEVRLHDDQVVVIKRRAVACAGGFPNSSRGSDLEFEISYEPMGVHWKGSGNRHPRSSEIFDGVPHLVLYARDVAFCQNQPPDRYLAQFLKWESGKWVEVPQSAFPVEQARLNLHIDYWGHTKAGDAKGLTKERAKITNGSEDTTIQQFFEQDRHFCDFYQK
mgnify:CR=1 FL=1